MKDLRTLFITVMIKNIFIILLVGFVVYWTDSLWALLGLLFLSGVSTNDDKQEAEDE